MTSNVLFLNWSCARLLASVGLLLLLSVNVSAQQSVDGEPIQHKLIKINDSTFNFFALKSQDALKAYSKILYFPMSSKNLVLKKSGDDEIDRSWKKAGPQDWLAFTSLLDDMAPKYFSADKLFPLVEQAGSDVLAVQFRLAEYTPRVNRKGEMAQDTVGHQEIRNYGDVLIIIMLVDSLTNEVVGVASDGISIGTGSIFAKNSSKSSQLLGWRRAYDVWLNKLREQLESSR